MAKIVRVIIIVMVTVASVSGAAQMQDEEHPLLQMLALVPDTVDVRESIVSYADYRAMEAVRGIDTPTAQDFDNGTDLSALWIASSMGISSGMQLNMLMPMLEEMELLVGFGFFDIDRSLTFNDPPGIGTILAGDLDPEQIRTAFTARDYTTEVSNGITVLCGANGCDSGMEMDLANRNPANPFGGQFGRSEPVALLPGGLLANSPSYAVIEAMLAAGQDEADSLADVASFRAIVEAAGEIGPVIQASFLSPMHLAFDPVMILGPSATAENQAALEDVLATYNALPPYTVAGLLDVSDGDDQIALIALVYGDAEIAQAAGEEVVHRLEIGKSFVTDQTFTEIFDERSITIDEPYVYEGDGVALAMIPLRYPVPGNEPNEDGPVFTASGMGYRFLITSVYRRDTTFLSPMIAED